RCDEAQNVGGRERGRIHVAVENHVDAARRAVQRQIVGRGRDSGRGACDHMRAGDDERQGLSGVVLSAGAGFANTSPDAAPTGGNWPKFGSPAIAFWSWSIAEPASNVVGVMLSVQLTSVLGIASPDPLSVICSVHVPTGFKPLNVRTPSGRKVPPNGAVPE